MKRESIGSTWFVLTCHDCGLLLRVEDHDGGFGAARTAATKRGWSFVRLDRCKTCTRHAEGKTSRKR